MQPDDLRSNKFALTIKLTPLYVLINAQFICQLKPTSNHKAMWFWNNMIVVSTDALKPKTHLLAAASVPHAIL